MSLLQTPPKFGGIVRCPQPATIDLDAAPEPSTLSLLALGGLAVIRRRRGKK
jgi:hypothetical protein